MRASFDIVIAGAGMVGLALANLFSRIPGEGRLRITVLDSGKTPEFDPAQDIAIRVSAISLRTVRILEQVGVWQSIIAERACPYRHMSVWDAESTATSQEAVQFDAGEYAVPELGFITENRLIRDRLAKNLGKSDVSLQFDQKISGVASVDHRHIVTLASGETLSAELLVAADGARSLIREQAGVSVQSWKYPQKAFVTHLRPETSHSNTAWQRFLGDGPIGLLPLADGRVSCVWSTTPETADLALQASDDELGDMLTEASDHVLGYLAPCGPRGAFPLHAQHAGHYVQPGLALIGDAAHSVHPLAGQGANLGFADALELAVVVEQALRAGECPGDLPVLRRYERRRRGENQLMLHFLDSLHKLFADRSPLLTRVRGTGMRIFNQSGPLKSYAVKVALGMR